jgi:hypothetical protein
MTVSHRVPTVSRLRGTRSDPLCPRVPPPKGTRWSGSPEDTHLGNDRVPTERDTVKTRGAT